LDPVSRILGALFDLLFLLLDVPGKHAKRLGNNPRHRGEPFVPSVWLASRIGVDKYTDDPHQIPVGDGTERTIKDESGLPIEHASDPVPPGKLLRCLAGMRTTWFRRVTAACSLLVTTTVKGQKSLHIHIEHCMNHPREGSL
jgi:hypothetical protein